MPHTETTVSRRRVLLGTAALALLGGAASACGSAPQRDPALDILTAELDRARRDSQLATSAATGVPPQLAPALASVAALRDAHARALSDELTRMGSPPPAAPSSTETSATTSAAPTPGATPAPAPPAPQEVVAALEQAADSAGRAAAGQSGYRAGLLASIAAACTAAHTVTLAGQAAP
ncbi:hypothetical protein [Mycolicibacterium phocaicum]|uniref:hypothetical protein n=1 Tax=Mycolicibacterium phocaicum TaxID=319706 RepID=UPI001CF9FFE1|nr:hypothetical protein [Mycolicibacterium phocaicum]UCZ62751.1 hypothetical protein LHJ73_11525 [Mycolicibacterium phocaicum]